MRVLVTGAGGVLGGYLVRRLRQTGADVVAWSGRREVDLTDAGAVEAAFAHARPDVVLHAAALSRVADCHRDPERAHLVNTAATAQLARLCQEAGRRMVFVSTDLVFDGTRAPYREDDAPAPLSVYGRSKAEAEPAVLACPEHVVARVSLLYGPALSAGPSFFDTLLDSLRYGRPVTLFEDEWRTPLALTTAADALVELASSGASGLFHVGGPERMSRLGMGRRLANLLRLDGGLIRAAKQTDVPAAEPRPRDVSLDSSRWRGANASVAWPGYEEALAAMLTLS
jgi:dTDP-4-dehydrorhamnose reductase